MTDPNLMIRIQKTPNPTALKFIANAPFIREGKATFKPNEAEENVTLVKDIFSIDGVIQIHLFQNVATVTFEDEGALGLSTDKVKVVIETRLPIHNSDFVPAGSKKKKKVWDDPEVVKIEEILDRTIRPGLQADGGDIEVLKFEDKNLTLAYQGACGTCPSAMYGTLDAIQSILHTEYDPTINIEIDDDSLYY